MPYPVPLSSAVAWTTNDFGGSSAILDNCNRIGLADAGTDLRVRRLHFLHGDTRFPQGTVQPGGRGGSTLDSSQHLPVRVPLSSGHERSTPWIVPRLAKPRVPARAKLPSAAELTARFPVLDESVIGNIRAYVSR